MKLWPACALLLVAGGCYTPTEKVTLRIELPQELLDQSASLSVLPKIAEAQRSLRHGSVTLQLKKRVGKVRLSLDGACPVLVDTRALTPEGVTEVELQPWFDVGPRERVVGLGQSFELTARPNCSEAERLRASFVVVRGAALEELQLSPDGRRLTARTGSAAPAKSATHGIIPVSAREQSAAHTELELRIRASDGRTLAQPLGVAALSRSSGLAEVGLTHPLLLDRDWRLLTKPPDSLSALRPAGNVLELRPDLSGAYALADGAGRTLTVHSGRYDEMPLDCGRSGCHTEIAQSAEQSPMTQALASDLGGCHSLDNPACASACHATGEPGTADGGFTHVLGELALPSLPLDYDELPRALRRLGGVGCLACHGPTKIPEPGQRAVLLKNDVCAVCHDAPPRYGHVQALEASRMGHADAVLATRQAPSCAACHTTAGALGKLDPEATREAVGITCVTCHDVHRHGAPSLTPNGVISRAPNKPAESLLRELALPVTLPAPPASFSGPSRVCIGCHAPTSNALRPEASAAALLAGQGGFDPVTGAAIEVASPHARSARGCLSCHDSGPDELVLGKSHAFRATEQSCQRCHAGPKQRDPALAERARRLLARLEPPPNATGLSMPHHASAPAPSSTPERARAVRDVLLVLEDPAADVHHPSYAKALLDAAETFARGAKP